MSLRSAPVPFVLLLAAACSSGGVGKPLTAGTSGQIDGAAGTGAAGTGSAGTAAAAGTGAAGTGANPAGADGGAGSPVPVVPALNYQLTGTWPKLAAALATKPGKLTYTKVTITDLYMAQSCAIADYNKDGVPDISSGRRWYEGPSFKTEHVFRTGHDVLPATGAGNELDSGLSDDQSDFAFDLDDDGWPDIINIADPDKREAQSFASPGYQPHATAYWYKNPGDRLTDDRLWTLWLMHDDVRHEHHGVADVDGDGRPEILGACLACPPRQTLGYYQANWSQPHLAWTYHPVTSQVVFPYGGGGYMHGLGFGDVNGDDKPDLLERGGVWLQQPGGTWSVDVCPAAGCGWLKTTFFEGRIEDPTNLGGSQMYAADFDGDGDADVYSADWAHGWGLSWYEQTPGLKFVRHKFMGSSAPADLAKYGPVVFSQPHTAQVVDMDGDGIPDIITGKSRYARPRGFGDADLEGTPYIYVFKTIRKPNANGDPVTFEPHLVDDAVGLGTQIGVGHVNTDGIVDLCVASKLGLHVFLGQ